jgi:hypothetical protein
MLHSTTSQSEKMSIALAKKNGCPFLDTSTIAQKMYAQTARLLQISRFQVAFKNAQSALAQDTLPYPDSLRQVFQHREFLRS